MTLKHNRQISIVPGIHDPCHLRGEKLTKSVEIAMNRATA